MRFEVPQFIEIEDKIFGPLTWRQFVYTAGGAGFAVALFFLTPFIIFVLFGIPIGALAFMLGFYPVNNRPFSVFLEAVVTYFAGTRLYLWRKKQNIVHRNEVSIETIRQHRSPAAGRSLHSLSRNLELNAIQK